MNVLHEIILICLYFYNSVLSVEALPIKRILMYAAHSRCISFFSKVFITNPPFHGGFHVCVKIQAVVLVDGGISSAVNTLDPFWLRS